MLLCETGTDWAMSQAGRFMTRRKGLKNPSWTVLLNSRRIIGLASVSISVSTGNNLASTCAGFGRYLTRPTQKTSTVLKHESDK